MAAEATVPEWPEALRGPARGRARKLPDFWTPGAWPPLVLASGATLPREAIDRLGGLLVANDEALADVVRALDDRSRAAFAGALFDAWQQAGASTRHKWALVAVARIGGEASTDALAAFARAHGGERGRSALAVAALAAIGSDDALAALFALSADRKRRAAAESAREAVTSIAAARDLTVDDLADRVVPRLGLDERGARTFDYGTRTFRVRVDDALQPIVDEGGGRLPDLPRPTKRDDADRAAVAYQLFKSFKKDLKSVVALESARLERAMIARRRWADAEHRARVVAHPLLGRLARRVVWGAYDGASLVASFRVAEDGTFADREDATFAVDPRLAVGVVHALEMPPDDLEAHARLLADYALIPPFAQLARETFRPSPEELPKRSIQRVRKRTVSVLRLFALEKYGWTRGPAGEDGMIGYYEKEVSGVSMTLALEPGLFAGDPLGEPEIELGDVFVFPKETAPTLDDLLRVDQLDPILFSEIARDLSLSFPPWPPPSPSAVPASST